MMVELSEDGYDFEELKREIDSAQQRRTRENGKCFSLYSYPFEFLLFATSFPSSSCCVVCELLLVYMQRQLTTLWQQKSRKL